jgi:hypothetical protein
LTETDIRWVRERIDLRRSPNHSAAKPLAAPVAVTVLHGVCVRKTRCGAMALGDIVNSDLAQQLFIILLR